MAAVRRLTPPKPPTPGVHPTPLPAGIVASLGSQRALANEQYKTGLVTNNASLGLARNSYAQQFRDLNQIYQKQRQQQPYNFNERGLLGSGIYNQGLQDLAQQHLRDFGDLQNRQSVALNQFHVAAQQLLMQRDQALAAIEAQRQAALAQASAGVFQANKPKATQ